VENTTPSGTQPRRGKHVTTQMILSYVPPEPNPSSGERGRNGSWEFFEGRTSQIYEVTI